MKKYIYSLVIFTVASLACSAQIAFTNGNSKFVNPAIHSGNSITVIDWNSDGLDDIIRLDAAYHPHLEVQQTNHQFISMDLGVVGNHRAWAMAAADIDNNGYKDFIYDINGNVRVVMTNATGVMSSYNISFPSLLQNCTFADFNNDGWVDLFACDDNLRAKIFLNNGSGTLASIPDTVSLTVWPGHCNGGCGGHTNDPWDAGNYGSVWTDFDNDGDLDLYIPHCRQGVNDTNDVRRWNRLFVNDGANHLIVDTVAPHGAYGLMDKWETWTSSFGDIDNDGDLDLMVTNHDHACQIFRNDGTGHFSEITAGTNFTIDIPMPMESVMEDFDNDGFEDIFIAGDWSRMHRNNGDGTFTLVNGLFDANNMESFSIGDLNHDGFVDIYGGYGVIYNTPTAINDVLWMNNTNSNHFITFDLRGAGGPGYTNKGAVGARATIFGAWGEHVREVRAGESYGTTNSAMVHFGLGSATTVDSVQIRWPSGIHQTLINPAVDQFVTVIEGDCVSPACTVSASGTALCTGGSPVVLTAPSGYSYLWSDGSTNQTLSVSTPGEYNVRVSSPGNNCTGVSRTVNLQLQPDQTPTITSTGNLEFCNGGSVLLSAPAGETSYLWSDGETTQTINATASGNYSVTIQGVCQTFTSNIINVNVHSATPATAMNVWLTGPGTATLNTTGTNVKWYDVPTGGSPIGSGLSFVTPVVNATTVFYAETSTSLPGPVHSTEMTYSNGQYGATNAKTYFDVYQNCTLQSVKVYTDLAGMRIIELHDGSGALVNSLHATIPLDSSVVTLNFALTPGTGYYLRTDSIQNMIINSAATNPRLQRNQTGAVYPYTIPGLLSVTGNSVGASYNYFFYDWQVKEADANCASIRTADTVYMSATGIKEMAVNATLNVYPNPANGYFNVEITSGIAEPATLTVTDVTGREISRKELNVKVGKNVMYADLSDNPNGFYFIRMTDQSGTTTVKATLLK